MDRTASVPEIDLDPFSMAFFDDPYPGHAAVREAAPVVWLPAINAYGIGRHAEVDHVLKDHRTYISARCVGIRDYLVHPPLRGPSMILETDPRSTGTLLRTAGLLVPDIAGMTLDPLSGRWKAGRDVSVNYIVQAVKG